MMIKCNIEDMRYINVKSLNNEITELCTKENGCYLSNNKKKILFTNTDFLEFIKKECKAKVIGRVQAFSLKYWFRKYKKHREIYFNESIVFTDDCIEATFEQVKDCYNEGEFDFENWEEFLDFQIKLVIMISTFGDIKDISSKFPENEINRTLEIMKDRNYDIELMKGIIYR